MSALGHKQTSKSISANVRLVPIADIRPLARPKFKPDGSHTHIFHYTLSHFI